MMRCPPPHFARCAIAALGFFCTTALAMSPPLLPTPIAATPSSTQMVAALNSVFGAHAHSRANHAKGVLVQALFTPTASAAGISRAPHFSGAPTPVLVRFSNFGGTPDIADSDPRAAPYGMALKFSLVDSTETDLVLHSYNGFPSATAADFVDFMTAMGQSPAHAPHPTKLERYADVHPQAKAFLAAPKRAPASFSAQPYFSVNTFKFSNAAGVVHHGRYRLVPVGPAHYLDPARMISAAPDYLRTELVTRIEGGPVLMLLQLQLAERGDALDDPSVAWPDTRSIVDLGVLSITSMIALVDPREQSVVFMPDDLPDGIESNDAMLKARTRAYAESLDRRLR